MHIDFDVENVSRTLCKMAMLENDTREIEKALEHLKAIAQNEYNQDYFRTLTKVLSTICEYDYLED